MRRAEAWLSELADRVTGAPLRAAAEPLVEHYRVGAHEKMSRFFGDVFVYLDGRGTMNGTPLRLEIRGGPFINIRRDRPYAFKAELSGVGSTPIADGAITRPFDLGQFTATPSL